MIYDVKHDGCHKSRFVAGGHLTDPNTESVNSGVISLRRIRLITFLGELNKHALWGADVGNAYLEARTNEQVYIIGGPEFGTMEGHTLGSSWTTIFRFMLASEICRCSKRPRFHSVQVRARCLDA
jgi:hypothetical protein